MQAIPIRGQVGGGWALKIETFLGPKPLQGPMSKFFLPHAHPPPHISIPPCISGQCSKLKSQNLLEL
jgi:hypothetical protein